MVYALNTSYLSPSTVSSCGMLPLDRIQNGSSDCTWRGMKASKIAFCCARLGPLGWKCTKTYPFLYCCVVLTPRWGNRTATTLAVFPFLERAVVRSRNPTRDKQLNTRCPSPRDLRIAQLDSLRIQKRAWLDAYLFTQSTRSKLVSG